MEAPSQIQKILAYQWLRIIIFIILTLAIYIPLSFSGIFFYDGVSVLSAYLISTLIIESLRIESRWFAFGIRIDKYFLYYLFIGFLFALAPMLLFIIIKLLIGYKISGLGINDSSALIQTIILTLIFAFSEELFFRGIIFQSLLEKYNPNFVIIIFSSIFGLAHFFNPNASIFSVVNTIFAGILMSYMYFHTKSLWFPISFHYFWNLFQNLLVDSPVSGYYSGNSFIRFEQIVEISFPEFISGSSYGIETTIFTTMFLLVMMLLVSKVKYSPFQNAILLKRKYAEAEIRYK